MKRERSGEEESVNSAKWRGRGGMERERKRGNGEGEKCRRR